jgi:hypothetical protein
MDFRKKFEQKYNVLLLDPVHSTPENPFNFITTPLEVKPNHIGPLTYSYVVVGDPQDVQAAVQGIEKYMGKY